MEPITRQIAEWLKASAILPLVKHGSASCALLSDYPTVCRINAEMRSLPEGWPDDHWIIGEDGVGGCFTVSRSCTYQGVQFYDHEWTRFEEFTPSLRDFFDYFIDIETKNQAEQDAPFNGG
jgi:hypothetical protein